MHVVSRAGDRPESVQALFSAIDSCSYPSISIDELSSSSSSSGEEQHSLQIKPHSGAAGEEEKCLSPSDFVCLSPEMSPESQENEEGDAQTEPERHPAVSPLVAHRTGERAATDPPSDSAEGGEACSSSGALDSNSQSRHSCGANGQHRTVAPHGNENLLVSSESEEETAVRPEDTRPQREQVLAQSALKRTYVGSEESESGSSPSEKKFKT